MAEVILTSNHNLVAIIYRLYSNFINVFLFSNLFVSTNFVAFQHHQDNAEDLTMADTDKMAVAAIISRDTARKMVLLSIIVYLRRFHVPTSFCSISDKNYVQHFTRVESGITRSA